MRAKLLLEDFMEKYRNQSRIFRNRSVIVSSIFRSRNKAVWFLRNRRVVGIWLAGYSGGEWQEHGQVEET